MSSSYSVDGWGRGPDKVPGARRQKVLGYIKAANEMRQTYQAQLQSQLKGDGNDGMPGGFPEADIVRSGDEEMLLFPSYAHRHIKRERGSDKPNNNDMPGSQVNIERPGTPGDADYWRREWEKYEDANAIVDVDVRGWIYTPQKGPMTRRNRLLLAVARRLSGVSAPDQYTGDYPDARSELSSRGRANDISMSLEEEAAAREAEMLTQRGQKEADAALRGTYSADSRHSSPSRSSTRTSLSDDSPSQTTLTSQTSWTQPAEMSREDLLKANEQLMTRLRPFMTLPLVNTPLTVFFFNDEKSISKSVHTDESGHFNLRAALNFVPSKVRVLASENLSAIEDVSITDAEGISLISDIDDTIKHSAIASGAREIFKNTFIRDLRELTIKGVKEWYTKMAQMGVKMHYVSNSPWQLYPLLKSYFSLAGLPPGSIHLKQYSGMLQGIFEPAAERKKGTLEKIFFDFPERKFILVGDSGEADLEVYTDIVLANPGRVLGVFIRDVTTAEKQKFYDSASPTGRANGSSSSLASTSDERSARPSLPTRPRPQPATSKVEEDLIDFSDDIPAPKLPKRASTYESDLKELQGDPSSKPQPPNRPTKPSNLRSYTTSAANSSNHSGSNDPSGPQSMRPPPPPKPRRSAGSSTSTHPTQESQRPPFSSTQQNQNKALRPEMGNRTSSSYSSKGEEEGYVASARRHISAAYNALPALRSTSPTREALDGPGPPSAPRRGLSAYPAAAARWATGATGGDPAAGGDGGLPGAPYNKKEEFWRRRWARAEDIMQRKGVVLKTWRVGSDVMDECVELASNAMKR